MSLVTMKDIDEKIRPLIEFLDGEEVVYSLIFVTEKESAALTNCGNQWDYIRLLSAGATASQYMKFPDKISQEIPSSDPTAEWGKEIKFKQ